METLDRNDSISIQDAEFEKIKQLAPVINSSHSRSIVDAEGGPWILLTEATKLCNLKDRKTIKNWEAADKRPIQKANVPNSNNQVRIVDIPWLKQCLESKGRKSDWIDNKEFNCVKPINGKIEITYAKSNGGVSLQTKGSSDATLTRIQDVLEWNSEEQGETAMVIGNLENQIEQMASVIKSLSEKPESIALPAPQMKISNSHKLIAGALISAATFAAACGFWAYEDLRDRGEARRIESVKQNALAEQSYQIKLDQLILELKNNNQQNLQRQNELKKEIKAIKKARMVIMPPFWYLGRTKEDYKEVVEK